MSEIGTERIEPTAWVAERLGNDPRREPRTRARRPAAEESGNSEREDNSEALQHQIDDLA
jgi:hypothetical protein